MIIPVTENLDCCDVSSIWEPYTKCMVEFVLLYRTSFSRCGLLLNAIHLEELHTA